MAPDPSGGRQRWIGSLALAVILVLPSLWMLANLPPLWRDVDAYIQVVKPPAVATYWGHGPLYCLAARVPLFLGSFGNSFIATRLTDSGVFLLILAQHAALATAGFFLIVTATRQLWARIALGIVWSLNPLFYTFAQCVGSETGSLILLLFLGTIGWRLLRRGRKASGWLWVGFGAVLLAAILTRYVNLCLVLLLPMALLISFGAKLLSRKAKDRRWRSLGGQAFLRAITLAIVIGIGSVLAANDATRLLCWTGHLRYHQLIGHTFMWRLEFLKALPAPERNRLLARVAARTTSPAARRLVELVRRDFNTRGDVLPIHLFIAEAGTALFPGETQRVGVRIDLAMNEMTRAFVSPPTAPHLRAAAADFMRAWQTTLSDGAAFLFRSTTYYFEDEAEMPQFANLVTFRGRTPAQILALPGRFIYWRWTGRLSLGRAFVLCAILLVACRLWAKGKRGSLHGLLSYACVLPLVGILMLLSTCLFGEMIPRYTLPAWALVFLSSFLLAGALMDSLPRPRA